MAISCEHKHLHFEDKSDTHDKAKTGQIGASYGSDGMIFLFWQSGNIVFLVQIDIYTF